MDWLRQDWRHARQQAADRRASSRRCASAIGSSSKAAEARRERGSASGSAGRSSCSRSGWRCASWRRPPRTTSASRGRPSRSRPGGRYLLEVELGVGAAPRPSRRRACRSAARSSRRGRRAPPTRAAALRLPLPERPLRRRRRPPSAVAAPGRHGHRPLAGRHHARASSSTGGGAGIEVPLAALRAGSGSAADAARRYLALGVEHILLGIDHLLFVLGLLLIVRGPWLLITTVTAFTLAHSLTLALATLGLVAVPSAPVEAAIALSIVFLAAEILRARQGRIGLTHRLPWLIAFGFGLLHGLGFAGALAEIGLPAGEIPLALLFFNLGVEVGPAAVRRGGPEPALGAAPPRDRLAGLARARCPPTRSAPSPASGSWSAPARSSPPDAASRGGRWRITAGWRSARRRSSYCSHKVLRSPHPDPPPQGGRETTAARPIATFPARGEPRRPDRTLPPPQGGRPGRPDRTLPTPQGRRRRRQSEVVSRIFCKLDHGCGGGPCGQRAALSTGQVGWFRPPCAGPPSCARAGRPCSGSGAPRASSRASRPRAPGPAASSSRRWERCARRGCAA